MPVSDEKTEWLRQFGVTVLPRGGTTGATSDDAPGQEAKAAGDGGGQSQGAVPTSDDGAKSGQATTTGDDQSGDATGDGQPTEKDLAFRQSPLPPKIENNTSDQPASSPVAAVQAADTDGPGASGEGGGASVDLEKIVNTGVSILKVMSENSILVNKPPNSANVVPDGVKWQKLIGGEPQTVAYHYRMPGIIDAIHGEDLMVRIDYIAGGSVGGAGQFINYAVVNVSGSVGALQKVTITAQFGNPYNGGKTAGNPIAMLPIDITITQSNIIGQNFSTVYSGIIKGSGGYIAR